MKIKDLNEDFEIGQETMTVEKENQDIVESIACDIKDEHIGEKTCLILETPAGDSTITLNGDYETNLLIVELLEDVLDSRYGKDGSPISFYSKAYSTVQEAEFLGKETKFEPNTIGAMVGLLQKSGQMTDKLEINDAVSKESMMPVSIEKPQDGIVILGVVKGTPEKEPAIPADEFMAPINN